jgi:hypothetical protein
MVNIRASFATDRSAGETARGFGVGVLAVEGILAVLVVDARVAEVVALGFADSGGS